MLQLVDYQARNSFVPMNATAAWIYSISLRGVIEIFDDVNIIGSLRGVTRKLNIKSDNARVRILKKNFSEVLNFCRNILRTVSQPLASLRLSSVYTGLSCRATPTPRMTQPPTDIC